MKDATLEREPNLYRLEQARQLILSLAILDLKEFLRKYSASNLEKELFEVCKAIDNLLTKYPDVQE